MPDPLPPHPLVVVADDSPSDEWRTGFPALIASGGRCEVVTTVVEAGDFEAVSSWYIGLHDPTCARVLTLTDPARLVIDIQQP